MPVIRLADFETNFATVVKSELFLWLWFLDFECLKNNLCTLLRSLDVINLASVLI